VADEIAERVAVVTAAKAWKGARWHHRAAVRPEGVSRGGIDCAMLLYQAHVEPGLIEPFEIEDYPQDWASHQDEERFLAAVERYAKPLADDSSAPLCERDPSFRVLPGNVLIFKWGRTFSHGAIVAQWPNIIHASLPARCVLEECLIGSPLAEVPMRVFSYWGS
jgi:cell wall-associated NlpC family hydrolase